jgi:hypothetical protein
MYTLRTIDSGVLIDQDFGDEIVGWSFRFLESER